MKISAALILSLHTYILKRERSYGVFEDDDDAEMYAGIDPRENAALRSKIDTYPETYLQIPGRDHGEHHDILRDFLNSNWTDDEEL